MSKIINIEDYKTKRTFMENKSSKGIKEYDPRVFEGTTAGGNISRNDIDRNEVLYGILNEVIDKADEVLLKVMLEAYDKDIDKLFKDIMNTAYRTLYGNLTNQKVEPTVRYLTEVDEQLKDALRVQSLGYFSSDVLGMEINWHHLEWSWLVENFLLISILAARDHGKSFFFSHATPIWNMYRYDRMNRNPRRLMGRLGYLFSNTLPQSIDLLEIIKDSIEDIPILKEKLYPTYRETWSKVAIKTKNGCRLRVRSFGSSVRGAHPGYIVVDDGLKDNVLYSKVQRERNKDYFSSVILNMLVPTGQMIVVGTPFHRDDLYSLFKKSVDFAYREYPAIDKNGILLWESRHDKQDLDMRKRTMGNIRFSREYLCQPISDDTAMFPEKILKRAIDTSYSYVQNIQAFTRVKLRKIVTGADFAKSAAVGADYTSFVTFGIDEVGNLWLLNLYHKKGVSFAEQKRVLRNIWRSFKPDIMYLEANQFQSIYTEQMQGESDMNVRPFLTTTKKHSLEDGVPGLAILFENAKFHFPYMIETDKEVTEEVLDEFRNIGWTEKGVQGVGEHDDIVMSIWIARMASLYGVSNFLATFIGDEEI